MRLPIVAILLVSTTAAAEKPSDRARTFVQAQLDAIIKQDDATVQATFAKDAILLSRGARNNAAPTVERSELLNGSPHSTFKSAKLKSLAAGGDDTLVWFTAEIVATYDEHEPEGQGQARDVPRLNRLTEVIVPDGSAWKAIAGVLDQPAPAEGSVDGPRSSIAKATKPGPLAPLLASPPDLVKALSKNPQLLVLGTDEKERALGPEAGKRLLGKWTKLGLAVDGDVREIETKTYALAEARVSYKKPSPYDKGKTLTYPMTALVVAVPAGDGWSVVAVHYTND